MMMHEHSFVNNSGNGAAATAAASNARFFKQIDEKHINQEIGQMLWVNQIIKWRRRGESGSRPWFMVPVSFISLS